MPARGVGGVQGMLVCVQTEVWTVLCVWGGGAVGEGGSVPARGVGWRAEGCPFSCRRRGCSWQRVVWRLKRPTLLPLLTCCCAAPAAAAASLLLLPCCWCRCYCYCCCCLSAFRVRTTLTSCSATHWTHPQSLLRAQQSCNTSADGSSRRHSRGQNSSSGCAGGRRSGEAHDP